ncbi:MAG: DUF3662 and FHA domain-containing protein [Solirubrobacterales bacterium]|nr:DUF3662 and FHA domain-containing protein [Solirubrobacterales bacterium]
MSVFRNLESRIAGLVEGTFSRAFRSEVRPVEIARRLAREMDENKKAFVSRVYAPTSYAVFLGPEDFDRFSPHEAELKAELGSYLLEHARRENMVLSERPRISIECDERLGLGEFGIKTTPVDREALAQAGGSSGSKARAPQPSSRPAPAMPPRATPVPPPVLPVVAPIAPPVSPPGAAGLGGSATEAPTSASGPPIPASASKATLSAAGYLIELDPAGMVLGRSRSCDVVLEDPNASRQHARVVLGGPGWMLEDMGSTNGVTVNGTKVDGAMQLKSGDVIGLGHTELEFQAG